MKENDKIFLTLDQVLDAIRRDFDQYESQFELFQELCPVITGNRNIVIREGRDDCVLITRGKKIKSRHVTHAELSRYLFDKLKETPFPLPIIAEICSKVFQTKSWVGQDAESERDGIWIQTEMSKFKCRQCGNCCHNLNYHNDCTENDYRRWIRLDRQDIIEKIMIIHPPGSGKTQYRIWKKPGTRQLYQKCPWLAFSSGNGRYECRIQDVKPEFCRQYPLTRKHAAMTGCQGTFSEIRMDLV